MQFGIFSVSDITRDPVSGYTPSEGERIEAVVEIAKKAEEVGFDVFGIGEHHNPPFFSSSPTTLLAYIAAKTSKIILSTATTLITTNDPVKIAEDYAMLQHLSNGRLDLMMGRGNTVPVYEWFGKSIYKSLPLSLENYDLLRNLWDNEVVNWEGKFRTPLNDFTSIPRPLDDVPPFVWHGVIRTAKVAEQAAKYGDGFFSNNIFGPSEAFVDLVEYYREKFAEYHQHDGKKPIVGIGGQVFIGKSKEEAMRDFKPYYDNISRIFSPGVPFEIYERETSLAVGTPEYVIEKTLNNRNYFGDYQRQTFLIDHNGLPLKTVLNQLELFGEYVLPVLKKETKAREPEDFVPAPTHASLVKTKYGDKTPPQFRPNPNRGDNVTGTSPYGQYE